MNLRRCIKRIIHFHTILYGGILVANEAKFHSVRCLLYRYVKYYLYQEVSINNPI